jgi:hypothetical protein
MKNLIIILSLFLFSCKASKQFTAQPTHERITTITKQVHDTVLVVKADTARLAAKLEVDSVGRVQLAKGSWQRAVGKRQLAKGNEQLAIGRANEPKVTIDDNNMLYVECDCDSAAIRFGWIETTTKDSTTTTIVPPPVIIEKPISKWRWVQIWLGRIFLFLILLYLLLFILKKLKYI